MGATLHLLGTGAPASDAHRTTTMLAISTKTDAVLIDCGGDVLRRAMQSGIPVEHVRAVILTHEHPDHVGGWPLFLEKIWLHGRSDPIEVYGPEAALDQARRCFSVFDTSRWEGLPVAKWIAVPLDEDTHFLELGPLRFKASPGNHGVPVMGLRVDNMETGGSICYSSDTKPSESIVRLASGCKILVHEASGDNPVHSTPSQAAQVAHDAQCGRLILVHLPPGLTDDDLIPARSIFASVELGEELSSFQF